MKCRICGEEIEEEIEVQMVFDDQLFEPMGYGTTLSLTIEKMSICRKCRKGS